MENQEFVIVDNQVVINLTGDLQGELAAAIREAVLGYLMMATPISDWISPG